MEIEQYHRQQRMIDSAGNVIAGRSNSFGEMERLGETLTQIGLASEQQRLDAQYHDQMNKGIIEMDRAFEDFRDKLDPDNTDKWLSDLENTQKPFENIKFSNEKARADFSTYREKEILFQRKSITDYRRVVDSQNFQRGYYRNHKESQEITANQPSTGEYDRKALEYIEYTYGFQLRKDIPLSDERIDITSENFDKYFEPKEGYRSPIFNSEENRKGEAKSWLRGTEVLYDKVQKEKLFQSMVDVVEEMPDRTTSIDFIDKNLTGVLEPAKCNELRGIANRHFDGKEAMAKQKEAVEIAKAEKELWSLVRAGDVKAVEEKLPGYFPDTLVFTDGTKKTDWDDEILSKVQNRAKQIIGGTEIKSDARQAAQFEMRALDISTGAVDRRQFEKDLADATFGDKPTISEKDYGSIMGVANREHSTYQANAMKMAIDDAENQLVTVGESLIESLFFVIEDETGRQAAESMKDKRKLELDNLSHFRKGLGDWFKDHPDADSDQIYTQSQKMIAQYRRFSLSEISSRRERSERELLSQSKYAGLDIKKLERLDAELTEGMQKEEQLPTQGKIEGSAAVNSDGTQIGTYNADGKITLNITGLRILKRQTAGNKELARKIIKEQGYTIPVE